MAKGLELRRRIKSVKNIRSITKAMQMVAASRMRKAQEAALRTRSYAEKALELLARLSEKVGNFKHYLLNKTEGHRYLILFITSNKGLCGSLNANSMRKVMEFMESEPGTTKEPSVFHFATLGKKGRDGLFRLGQKVTADFSDVGESLSFLDIAPLSKHLLEEFKVGNYDQVYIVYSHFLSVLVQKPIVKRVVPLGADILESVKDLMHTKVSSEKEGSYEYKFEPDPKNVLEELLPRLVEMQIYQAVLESYASEQSARMVAMKNATEAAGDLMDDLTLTYNKTRQAAITQEISEIVGGVEAMKK